MKKIHINFNNILQPKFYRPEFYCSINLVNSTGLSSDNDFYQNTYLDAISNSSLTWTIVNDSMPSNWEFSNCFPMCHPIGVTSGSLNIYSGQDYYLNCHFYPHNTAGEGFVTMEITDSLQLNWLFGIAGSVGIVDSWYSSQKNIKVIYDLNGKIVWILNQIIYILCNTKITPLVKFLLTGNKRTVG